MGDDGDSFGVPWVAADVPSGIETLWIETVGVDLVAAMVAIPLLNRLAELVIKGANPAQLVAEEVAPACG